MVNVSLEINTSSFKPHIEVTSINQVDTQVSLYLHLLQLPSSRVHLPQTLRFPHGRLAGRPSPLPHLRAHLATVRNGHDVLHLPLVFDNWLLDEDWVARVRCQFEFGGLNLRHLRLQLALVCGELLLPLLPTRRVIEDGPVRVDIGVPSILTPSKA